MLHRIADGAMLVNEDGNVILWNKAADRLLGFRSEDLIGRPCRDVLCGETLGEPLCSPSCPIGSKLAGGGGVRNYEICRPIRSPAVSSGSISARFPFPLGEMGSSWQCIFFETSPNRSQCCD